MKASEKEKIFTSGEMQDYSSFEIQLLPLRADSSYSLRQQHYATAIATLTKALDNILVNEETDEHSAQGVAKKAGL